MEGQSKEIISKMKEMEGEPKEIVNNRRGSEAYRRR
jgi:hypothetical protein